MRNTNFASHTCFSSAKTSTQLLRAFEITSVLSLASFTCDLCVALARTVAAALYSLSQSLLLFQSLNYSSVYLNRFNLHFRCVVSCLRSQRFNKSTAILGIFRVCVSRKLSQLRAPRSLQWATKIGAQKMRHYKGPSKSFGACGVCWVRGAEIVFKTGSNTWSQIK